MGCTGSRGAGFSAWRKTLSLLAFLGLAAASSSAQAQIYDINTSAGNAVYDQTEVAVFVDNAIVVTGTQNLDGARVAITTGFDAIGDRLSFTSQHGITGAYDNTTGILNLSGSATPTQYQDVLRTVRYESVTTGNPPAGTRTIQFSLGASIFFEPNGHFYEFVSAPGIDWADARNAAAARSYFGLQGYLVTVTSAAENSFVAGKLSGQGWMGASDAILEGQWRWVTGPEGLEELGLGRYFFQQTPFGTGGSAVNGNYHNWASGEPNDAGGEDHAHFLTNGQWNDYRFDNNAISGYVVEYGGMPSDPTINIVATRDLDVLTCFDNTFNGVETDVDCGDVCGPCGDSQNCADDSDCTSGVCDGGVCQAPTCTDGVQNGTETGTDCGGSCAGCGTGGTCSIATDCESLNCQGGVCQAATCSDGIMNGDETDMDCGGSCGACGVNSGCDDGTDCTTGVCSGGVCQAATCSDGTQNQDETDVDCGGATCGTCPDGAACSAPSDCLSGLCDNGVCIMHSFDIETSTGAAVYDQTEVAVVVDDAIVVTGTTDLDGAQVAITTGFDATGDRLSFTAQHGITGTYDLTTGILSLSGTASPTEYQDVLRTVRYESTTSGNPPAGARTIQFSLGAAGFYFEPNGHFYEFVSAPGITWQAASAAAQSRRYFGYQGYLVTVTSAAENQFVFDKLLGQGWMGASDEAVEGTWRWVTGPEGLEDSGQGRHFFTQTPFGTGGVAVNGEYANWDSNEPNNLGGEDFAHFLDSGLWNDYPFNAAPIQGYVVEYGGLPSDPVINVVATRDVEVLTCFDGIFNGVETDIDCGDVCGPCGDLENCSDDSDCTSGVCSSGVCQVPTCSDGVQNGDESDVDCGGSCDGCGTGGVCSSASDCASGNCDAGQCLAPTCTDGIQNQDETDVDCGGTTCGPCGDGGACNQPSECSSGVCTGNVCQTATCTDGVQNGDETDVDCGGSCGPCADGGSCGAPGDCTSGVCDSGQCAVPTCTDGVDNGDETDVDCGGSCGPCNDGGSCSVPGDCTSGVCDNGTCETAQCNDGVQNGTESDVDCGGSCGPCADGGSCASAGDCSSGVCDSGQCAIPTCTDGVQNADETDVDCGGGTCGACGDGSACSVAGDCSTNLCSAGVCVVTIDSLGEITSPAEDELLSTATPTISGTSEAGTTIEIFVDGVLVATPVADSNGDWTYTPEDDLDDGARVIEAVFTDGIGNQTTSEVNVVVDTTAPQVTVTSPANGELLSVTPERITGESEPGNEINVYINSEFAGTTTADENGAWELEIDPLDLGDYTVRVTSRDEADNIGETESDFSIVDGVRIATPEDDQIIRIARPTISGVSTPNTDVQLFLNDTPVATVTADENGNWTYTPDSDLADGEFELRAEGAGESTDSVSFTVDTTRTGLVIDEPAEGALVNQNTVTFRGTALAGSTVTVTVDGAEVGQVTADENGAWEWESPEFDDGELTVEFTSENEIGEPETASRTITVDTTAPSLEVTSPLAGESFPEDGIITGQAEPGATVEVFVDDTLVGETTADENGDWAVELPEDFDAAAGGDLRVTATDEAGNSTTVELSVPEDVVETVDARILEGGCEGCAAATNSTEASFWLLAFGLFLLGRRRRVRAR